MNNSEEINNRDKARTKRGAIARGKKDQYPQYDFDKFPHLKQNSSHVEWTKFCKIDHMRKMNVSQSFFFRKYLPLSLLGRITRWQLFNSRTTRLINCHKNGRHAGSCRHTLREWSLVTDIVQYHISVHQLRSPRKGNDKTAFTSIKFSI